MTVPSTSIKAGPFDGNDVATTFPFTFPCFSTTDLRVVEAVIATGIETDLVLDSGYSVTLNADQEVSPGGSITYKVAGVTTALPSTKTLVTLSNVGNTQPTSLPDGGAWRPKVVERALDRLTLQVKQIVEDLSRTFKVDVTSDSDVDTLLASVNAKAAEAVAAADTVTDVAAGLASSSGSSFIGFIQSGTGAVSRTAQDKLREQMRVSDFGALGTSDDTLVWQAAINAASGRKLYAPTGTFIVTALTGIDNIEIIGEGIGRTILQRKASASGNSSILSFSGQTNFSVRGITFDGNKASQSNAANTVAIDTSDNASIEYCEFINSKASGGGYGSGIVITSGTGETNKRKIAVLNNRFEANDGVDIYVNKTWYVEIAGNYMKGSGGGVSVLNYVFPPVADVHNYINIHDNIIRDQTGSGITVYGYIVSGASAAVQVFGPSTPQARHTLIQSNTTANCSLYGIAFQGANGSVTGNTVYGCGDASGGGGILFNTYGSVLSGNTIRDCRHFGVDAGGSWSSSIVGNTLFWNGSSAVETATDINCGGAFRMLVSNNVIEQAGTQAMTGIAALGFEGDGIAPFPIATTVPTGLSISNNVITLNGAASSLGIWVYGGQERVTLHGNQITGALDYFHALKVEATGVVCSGNHDEYSYASGSVIPTIASAATTVIPDHGEKFFISGTTGITKILTDSANTYNGKIRECYANVHGTGYSRTTPPTVTFSGGGGSGLAVTANVSYDGTVVNWTVTNHGSGYTSAPTPSITHNGGSGATCLPQLGCSNFEGREITLFFQGILTLTDGTGLDLNGNFTTEANVSVLRLIGAYGGWHEISRR